VLDEGDFVVSSVLNLENAQYRAVPTPALLPGLVAMGIAALRKNREDESSEQES